MNFKQKKKRPVVAITSISCVVVMAILGAIYYLYYAPQNSTSDDSTQQSLVADSSETAHSPAETNETPRAELPKDSSEEASEETATTSNEQVEQPTTVPPTEKQPEQQTEKATPAEEPEQKQEIVNGYIAGQQPATEPTYVDGVLIVNKKNPLPSTYNKGEDPTARAAFEKMALAAKEEGIELVAFSGFRSYEYQTTLYNRYVAKDGKEAADRYSARPGYSEHQSGLAFDIGEKGREDLWLTSEFGETAAGQWLVNNAHQYGFILRYPEGKEDITGFMYESWHFRYLEDDLATKIHEAGVTLEEYLGLE